jgi:hypothetical protein
MGQLPIAHAGHVLVDLLYLVPLAIVVTMLWLSSARDKRAEAAEAAAGGAGPADESDAELDEQATP